MSAPIGVERSSGGWTTVCRYDELSPGRGVAALVDGSQIAVFRLDDGGLYAVGHRDPFSGANVIARGIVGSRGDVPVVFSPMFKQAFDLTTGLCLDDGSVGLPWYPVRVKGELVEVEVRGVPSGLLASPGAV